jgi:hypothetical protein
VRDPNGKWKAGRLWWVGEIASFADLGRLIARFNVKVIVIDAHPDLHKAKEFVLENRPTAWLAYYDRYQPGHEPVQGTGGTPNVININRAEALEALTDRFSKSDLSLPRDARGLGGRFDGEIGEFYRQMVVSRRTLDQDAQGNWLSGWPKPTRPDHYFHADSYCCIAAGLYKSNLIEAHRAGGR